MRNIKLTLEYDGADFCGFAPQIAKRSVRGEIEKALFKLYKTHIKVIGASRTDAGVHALCQSVNFAVKQNIPIDKIPTALNSCLPDDIRILSAKIVSKNFNARFSAKSKEYEYLIYNGKDLPVHIRKIVWQVRRKLKFSAMRKAAKFLVGKRDFSSFATSGGSAKTFSRNLKKVEIRKSKIIIWKGSRFEVLCFKIKGDGFLYRMVRNMVGTLVDVGLGKISPQKVKEILNLKNRKFAGRCAPPQGLCLTKVNY